MSVTEVRVFLREGGKATKAVASLTLDGAFAVKNLKVMEGARGLFVSMPGRKLANGTWSDVAHPITRELNREIQERVLEAYRKTVQAGGR